LFCEPKVLRHNIGYWPPSLTSAWGSNSIIQ
jgi:hypothetical protein